MAALARAALQFAHAGADCVAPSDMQDGRVAAIRTALDDAGFQRRALMSYAAKFHSAFYGHSGSPLIPHRTRRMH